MKNKTELIQLLTRIQLISSIVWATIMIASALVLGGSYREISLILIGGYLVEFLLISSSKNKLKKAQQEEI
jgi:hypothetical protein